MDNVGLLLRGSSLEKLPLVCDKFDDCYVVNDWNKEMEMFGKYLQGKNIIHCANSLQDALLSKKIYKDFNINEVLFSFAESALKNKSYSVTDGYRKKGVETFKFIPENCSSITEKIKNTGVCCIFYVSEFIKPKTIWILGLEFYRENYLVKPNASHQLEKTKKIDLVNSFVDIVKRYPHIQYNLITYYKKLPKIDNMNILEI